MNPRVSLNPIRWWLSTGYLSSEIFVGSTNELLYSREGNGHG